MQKRLQKSGKPRIHFPRDEGAHSNFAAEWWYGHFNLNDAEGRKYGAMAAYFNFGLRIMAVSDLDAEKSYHTVSGSRFYCTGDPFELRWGSRDLWYRSDPNEYVYRIESYGPDMGLDLALRSQKPPLLGCGSGLIKWTGGTAYYYQFTRLQAEGRMTLPGKEVEVEGLGVMDHQWMNYLGPGGWDWFCVQLDNDTELVFWHIVNPDDSVKHRDMSVMFPDCSMYHSRRFLLESLDSWISPESGRKYSVRWRVREKALDLDLQLRARYPQQELRMFENLSVDTFPFWEGNTVVSGHMNGEAVSGTGFAEFVRSPERTKQAAGAIH